MIKYLLWDVDDTLINFGNAEDFAMHKGFKEFGFKDLTAEGLDQYKVINARYWQELEAGTMDRKGIMRGRFAEFFDAYGVDHSAEDIDKFNIFYQTELGKSHDYLPHAEEVLINLGKDYKNYGVTNGSSIAQEGKLKGSGLINILEDVFISEDVGHDKPAAEFFHHVFEKVGSHDLSEYVIIGDSLTSDMRGGERMGITNIWYNPLGKENQLGVKIAHEVQSLAEIPALIRSIDD